MGMMLADGDWARI